MYVIYVIKAVSHLFNDILHFEFQNIVVSSTLIMCMIPKYPLVFAGLLNNLVSNALLSSPRHATSKSNPTMGLLGH